MCRFTQQVQFTTASRASLNPLDAQLGTLHVFGDWYLPLNAQGVGLSVSFFGRIQHWGLEVKKTQSPSPKACHGSFEDGSH